MGQINISGTSADVQLKSNNSITANQAFTFPDTGGTVVTSDSDGDVEITGNLEVDSITATSGKFEIDDRGTITRPGTGGNYYSLGNFNNSGTTSGATGGRLVLNSDSSGSVDTETIALNGEDGSAEFVGVITASSGSGDNAKKVLIYPDGGVVCNRTDSGENKTFNAQLNGSTNAWIRADGNAKFKSTNASSFFIDLDPDNSANYVSTTNADGETESVYNGPQLDVKESIRNMQAALYRLKAAVLIPDTTVDQLRLRILEALETITEEVD